MLAALLRLIGCLSLHRGAFGAVESRWILSLRNFDREFEMFLHQMLPTDSISCIAEMLLCLRPDARAAHDGGQYSTHDSAFPNLALRSVCYFSASSCPVLSTWPSAANLRSLTLVIFPIVFLAAFHPDIRMISGFKP